MPSTVPYSYTLPCTSRSYICTLDRVTAHLLRTYVMYKIIGSLQCPPFPPSLLLMYAHLVMIPRCLERGERRRGRPRRTPQIKHAHPSLASPRLASPGLEAAAEHMYILVILNIWKCAEYMRHASPRITVYSPSGTLVAR